MVRKSKKEKYKLSSWYYDLFKKANSKEKWCLLPFITHKKKINFDEGYHQAISKLFEMRNKLIHTNFKEIKSTLSKSDYSPSNIIKYYNRFIDAVFDMIKILREMSEDDFDKKYKEVIKNLKF